MEIDIPAEQETNHKIVHYRKASTFIISLDFIIHAILWFLFASFILKFCGNILIVIDLDNVADNMMKHVDQNKDIFMSF